MALIVNKNLSAMSAHRYLKANETSFSKSIERLSSGMKINRAADDPAGLVISEKFRAQVEGLQQAIKNSQDGISLVQTAEGSMEEVTTALRSMRKLALHASNTGASDANARAADQEQINQAINTINRIANTTAFGNRKLLDGSAGVTGVSSNDDITFMSGSTATVAGTYQVSVTQAAEKGISAGEEIMERVTAFEVTGIDVDSITQGDTLTLSGAMFNGKSITVSAPTTSAGGTDTGAADDLAAAVQTALRDHFGGTSINAVWNAGDLEITGLNHLADGDESSGTNPIAVAQSGGSFGGAISYNISGTDNTVSESTKLSQTEILTIKNGEGSNVSVTLAAGTTIGDSVTQLNNALEAAGWGVSVEFGGAADNKTFVFKNDDYGASDVVKYSFTSNKGSDDNSLNIVSAAGTSVFIADAYAGNTGYAGVETGLNVEGTIAGVEASSSGGVYLAAASGTNAQGISVKIAGGVSPFTGSVTVEQNSLNFQVGAFEGQGVKLQLADMRTDKLGMTASGSFAEMSAVNISNIDVTTEEGAQEAIRVIDAALGEVSTARADMGSFQKDVLEATVRNLGVAVENMSASEAQIRDADMAEEMLSFSRAQILQSTSMAMLAQANQAPQAIMRLFG